MTSHVQLVGLVVFCVLIASWLAAPAQKAKTVRVQTRDEWQAALRSATAGTTILVAPGTYAGGLSQADLRGTPDRPIVIAAADPQQPPVLQGGSQGLYLAAPSHVVLRDLIIRGAEHNGLNIDDGGVQNPPALGISLINLTVTDIGPRGNRDGIKLSGVADFKIDNCRVESWGDSGSAIDLVGCLAGSIFDCTFRAARSDLATGVQCKGGTHGVTISHCRFENAGGRAVNIGGSTGLAYFRPKPKGFEAKDIFVEDCVFIGSVAPIAFVGVDGAKVQHNLIYRPKRWVVRILQETQLPEFVPSRNGVFANNVIVFRSNELATTVNVGEKTAPETFKFADNVWYCLDRPQATDRLIRLPTPETGGRYGLDPRLRDPQQGDFRITNEDIKPAGPRPRPDG